MRLSSGRFVRREEERRDPAQTDEKTGLTEEEVDEGGEDHDHIWEIGIGS